MNHFICGVLLFIGFINKDFSFCSAAIQKDPITSHIHNVLRNHASQFPKVARFVQLGYSREGRLISSLLLSSGFDPNKPAIYFNGGHHGNEQASIESMLGIIDYIISNASKPEVKSFLEDYQLIFQPVVNPDGVEYGTRHDSLGRDPNRDYPHPSKTKDEKSFELPETRIVQDLHSTYNIVGAAAFHSGMEGVLWPWGYSKELNPEHSKFIHLSEKTASAMGFSYFRQSFYDYATKGEYIDWAYLTHGTFAITVEVSNHNKPPKNYLDRLISRTIKGTLAFIQALKSLEKKS